MRLTADQLRQCMPRCPAEHLDEYARLMGAAMAEAEVNTVARGACWFGQWSIESGDLRYWAELCTYSAARILQLWPRRFTPQEAAAYAGHPERIANRAYAGRNGNGDEASGDGWLFRGRGPPQLSGRGNFRAAGEALGLQLEQQPELVELPSFGFRVAAWFWLTHGCNPFADAMDVPGVTRAINGGQTDLALRQTATDRARVVLERTAILA